jgi:hypothetical protein
MLLPLLLSAVMALPTGTIEGNISLPEKVKASKPIQVTVFSGDYVNLYLAEVQERIDDYWEEYRRLFIENKEAFLVFRDRAQRQAMESTLNQMRRDDPLHYSNFVHTTTGNTFEFRAVPQGECKVVALITIGNQEFVWSETVILTEKSPAFVTLKPTNP